jgi:hypothetical protein
MPDDDEKKELEKLRKEKADREAEAAKAAEKEKEQEQEPSMSDEEMAELKQLRKEKAERNKADLESIKRKLKARGVSKEKLEKIKTLKEAELLIDVLPAPSRGQSRSPLPAGQGTLDPPEGPKFPTNESEARDLGYPHFTDINHQAKALSSVPVGPTVTEAQKGV